MICCAENLISMRNNTETMTAVISLKQSAPTHTWAFLKLRSDMRSLLQPLRLASAELQKLNHRVFG